MVRLTVDTCEADDEYALRLYRARGLVGVRETTEDRAITPAVAERIRSSWIST